MNNKADRNRAVARVVLVIVLASLGACQQEPAGPPAPTVAPAPVPAPAPAPAPAVVPVVPPQTPIAAVPEGQPAPAPVQPGAPPAAPPAQPTPPSPPAQPGAPVPAPDTKPGLGQLELPKGPITIGGVTLPGSGDPAAKPTTAGADTVRKFWSLVDAGKTALAVAMFSPAASPSLGSRAAWKKNLDSIEAVKIKILSKSPNPGLAAGSEQYMVVLDMTTKPSTDPSRPPEAGPEYGWENGANTRFMTLASQNGVWMIAAIATGP